MGSQKRGQSTSESGGVSCCYSWWYAALAWRTNYPQRLSAWHAINQKRKCSHYCTYYNGQAWGERAVTRANKWKMESSLLFSYVQHTRRNFACLAPSHPSPSEDWFTNFFAFAEVVSQEWELLFWLCHLFLFNVPSTVRQQKQIYVLLCVSGKWRLWIREEAMRKKMI